MVAGGRAWACAAGWMPKVYLTEQLTTLINLLANRVLRGETSYQAVVARSKPCPGPAYTVAAFSVAGHAYRNDSKLPVMPGELPCATQAYGYAKRQR